VEPGGETEMAMQQSSGLGEAPREIHRHAECEHN
jgi:hypothetical protein